MRELSLFTGYGGMTLGLRLAGWEVRTVAYCEIDPYCQEIIKARIKDGYLDDAPIWPDIRTLNGKELAGLVDIITGGFPCQPHSTAGQRKGAADPRNLWPDTARLIGEIRPGFVLLENVPGLIYGRQPYVGAVLGDLASIGYDCRWGLVPAAAVGAPHLRWRWWCLAYPAELRRPECAGWQQRSTFEKGRVQELVSDGETGQVADANSRRSETPRTQNRFQWASTFDGGSMGNSNSEGQADLQRQSSNAEPQGNGTLNPTGWWSVEPPLGRVVDGCPDRVGQLSALGNGVVSAVVAEFLRLICR